MARTLLVELDVDQVWLRAVALPVGVDVVVPKLLDSVARLGGGQRPHRHLPDLALLDRAGHGELATNASREAQTREGRRRRSKGAGGAVCARKRVGSSASGASAADRISRPPHDRPRRELRRGANKNSRSERREISHGAARRGHGSQAPAAAAMRRDDGGWLGGVSGRSQDGTAAMRCQHSRLPLCLATAAAASSMAQTWAARCRSSRAAGSAGAADARVAFGEGGQHRRRR